MTAETPTPRRRGVFARLGTLCVRRAIPIIVLWLGIVVAMGIVAPRLGDALDPGGFEISGSDSHRVPEITRTRFSREYASGLTAVISSEGRAARTAAIRATDGRIRTIAARYPDLVRAVDPLRLTADGRTGAVLIGLERGLDTTVREADPLLDDLDRAGVSGVTVLVTGGAAVFRDFNAVNEHDLRRAEIIQAPIVLAILLLLMGSVLGAALPLLSAAVAMVATLGALWWVTRGVDLSIYVRSIVPLIGIGVSIDYSLFMVTRFREERTAADVADAVVATMATAGRAVFFSGLTVIVALGAMATVRVPMFTAFAIGATAVVAAAVATALTLVPAILALLGGRLGSADRRSGPLGLRAAARLEHWAAAVMRRRTIALVISTIVLLALSAPVTVMRLGASGTSAMPDSLPSIQAADIIAKAAGPGAVAPIRVIVDGSGTPPQTSAVDAARSAVAADPGVLATTGARSSDDGTLAMFDVISTFDEDDRRSSDLVEQLRSDILPGALDAQGLRAYVGGAPAQNTDFVAAVADRLPVVIALVMILTFIVLVVLFRSIVLPLKAVLLTLVSVLASYGVLVAVFQWGWLSGALGFTSLGHVTAWVPPLLFCLLFGLSMDYEVFLITRIRERMDETDDQESAIAWGVGRSGRIITAAAAIMVVVFLSFVTNRLIPVKEAALGMAVAVFIDATVVRIVMVPAFMAIAGRWNWWMPRWLDRLLPAVRPTG